MQKLDKSAILTVVGILIFFSISVAITVIAPSHIDPSWTSPSSSYQKQMHEFSDPNTYISTSATGSKDISVVYHMHTGETLSAFKETETIRIIGPRDLEVYVTSFGSESLKLTNRLLLLRKPENEGSTTYSAYLKATNLQDELQRKWQASHPSWKEQGLTLPAYTVFEIYDPQKDEAFVILDTDGIYENWVPDKYSVIEADEYPDSGVIYVKNPHEYRVRPYRFGRLQGWKYDPSGTAIQTLGELKNSKMKFLSRKELINMGEEIYANEGCWYCHTDQSRTLVQDSVLNGSELYPAPPSSANEYIYQNITMTGTRRIGPDLSRVGVKRPGRDWHKAHFWSPGTKSAGSIMPPFTHFFDDDPRGTPNNPYGVPNWRFEAIFQYLMVKGTRITAPNQAWWKGKDPVHILDVLERQPISHQ